MPALLYTQDHEWVDLDESGARVGISEYAQDQIGEVVFVELPSAGTRIKKGDSFATIESVKSANEIYAPVSGEIVEVNDKLNDSPELVNQSAENEGWLVRIKPDSSDKPESLMDSEAYKKFCEEAS